LKRNDRNIYEKVIKERKILAVADGTDLSVSNYRTEFSNLIAVIASPESPERTEVIRKFFEAYNAVPWEVQLKCIKISLTKEDIKNFADWCNRQTCLWQAMASSAYTRVSTK
jgi:hypothetical protein